MFLKTETIDKAIEYFEKNNLDSLCASRVAQTLCFMDLYGFLILKKIIIIILEVIGFDNINNYYDTKLKSETG